MFRRSLPSHAAVCGAGVASGSSTASVASSVGSAVGFRVGLAVARGSWDLPGSAEALGRGVFCSVSSSVMSTNSSPTLRHELLRREHRRLIAGVLLDGGVEVGGVEHRAGDRDVAAHEDDQSASRPAIERMRVEALPTLLSLARR